MIQNKPDELVHTGHFYCFYSFLLVFTKKSQFIKTQKVYSKILTLTDAKYTISCKKIQGNTWNKICLADGTKSCGRDTAENLGCVHHKNILQVEKYINKFIFSSTIIYQKSFTLKDCSLRKKALKPTLRTGHYFRPVSEFGISNLNISSILECRQLNT